MKFRLVEGFDNELRNDFADVVLNEELLLEENFYKVIVKNGNPFYFIGTEDRDTIKSLKTARDVYNYISNIKSNKEKVNDSLLTELNSLGSTNIDIKDISSNYTTFIKHPIYKKRLLNSTFRTSRNHGNNIVKDNGGKKDIESSFKKLKVHHIDGVEYNNNEDNLVGLEGNTLHQLVHLLDVKNTSTGTVAWEGTFNSAIHDGSKFVIKPCKITVTI